MEAPSDPTPRYLRWLSRRTTFVVLGALGLLLLVFQVNKMLTSSFRIEIFGVEILEVQHLDEATAGEAPPEETPAIREQRQMLPRAPASPVMPSDDLCTEASPASPATAPRKPSGAGPEIFVVVEEMPQLIGGLASIQRQLRYPEIAKRAGLEGRVILQFVVDERGCVTEPQVVRGIGGGCDEEALRVVSRTRFRPGKQRGKPVKVKMSLPVTFKLQ